MLRHLMLVALIGIIVAQPGLAEQKPYRGMIDEKIPNFSLQSQDGKPVALAQKDLHPKATVVVFLSFDCPISTSYSDLLAKYHKHYAPLGTRFLGICPKDEGSSAEIAKKAKAHRIPFPVLRDFKAVSVKALQAQITPEVFVLDRERVLRYRGRIDDTWFGRLKKNAKTRSDDLKIALEEVLAGKSVSTTATTAVGCPITLTGDLPETGAVTFYRDVLPVLKKNCQSCHKPGGSAPFSLLTYQQAVNWGQDIKEYTHSRAMPPWKPTGGPAFRNERKLSTKEIALLGKWVDSRMPKGKAVAQAVPKISPKKWQLGKPDLILTMKDEFTLGPAGPDHFRCFVFPLNLKKDRHITAVEVHPGNSRIVHHAVLLLDSKQRGRASEKRSSRKPNKFGDQGSGYFSPMALDLFADSLFGSWPLLGVWAPGQRPTHLPNGTGYHVPKGSDLVMQVHYNRSGKVEKDRTSIGVYFAKEPVKKVVEGLGVPAQFFRIPAGAKKHQVSGTIWINRNITIHSVFPHMHLLGKTMKVTMTPPGGQTQTLIEVSDWDFNWQETYYYKKPIRAVAGTRFDIEATFDNSEANPFNPNSPPKNVYRGVQTTNEMCQVLLEATPDKPGRIWPRFWAPTSAKKSGK